jgi:hypothetical protein
MVREVRSPWSSNGSEPRRGESPGAYAQRADRRADSGHVAPSPGKGPRLRADGDLSLERGVPVRSRGDRR